MIRQLFAVLGPAHTPALRRLSALLIAAALSQGIAFATLVPLVRALLSPDPASAWAPLGGMVVAASVAVVAQFIAQRQGFRVGSAVARRLHHRLGDAIARLPLGWFNPARVGELARTSNQRVMAVMTVPAHLLRPLCNGVVSPAAAIAAMYLFDWRLALVMTLFAPVLALVAKRASDIVQRSDSARDEAMVESANRVVEFTRNQPVLRAFGQEGRGRRLLDEALRTRRDVDRSMIWRSLPGLTGFGFMVRVGFAVMLVLGVAFVMDDTLDVPTMLAVTVLVARFLEPMTVAADLSAALRLSSNALNEVNRVIQEPTLPEPVTPRLPASTEVEFDGVGFGYGEAAVLRDVSFRMPARGLTALVGPSGSGKTTIARLLARFWDVDAGAVRIGGIPVTDIGTEGLTPLVSTVFQDVYLFDGTVRDNVLLGRPDASEDELRAAATLAGLDEVVAELPEGWETTVGEGGTRLSGGQRQRVSIARALVKDSPIVVLDEATASLDPENDAIIQAAISTLAKDKALLVIAHRLNTVTSADRILVLDEGRIVQQGGHHELVDVPGPYQEFWRSRSRAKGWRLSSAR
ncbi:ATP-binding cassette subfamily B protein [Actinoalloteichus hoggarensis]|uniref:Iron import ATP-binding/permease protein IrtB n=1 Tax=Actinoalloteichus hoggarensis TaxID=1470176 RepID=A0A221W4E7_9PSEU|nr:ABC transporter ATP-binding protein [Actinoalloteichus hoggarensis]ASO20583.1 Iron import ATP-binding/permease protein IrtB [Actinoalloteichus hoggarensis]MBB5923624.1 ATP-binding cassette subfamily B protein [Actinoalloteichus hoggarensis]